MMVRKTGKSSHGRRGQICSAATQSMHSTPRHQTLLSTGERRGTTTLSTFPLSSSFISSYRCLVVICVSGGEPLIALICLSSVPRDVHYIRPFSALPQKPGSAGFLMLKSPLFTINIQEKFFEENFVFIYL